jgi:hypothetical protein
VFVVVNAAVVLNGLEERKKRVEKKQESAETLRRFTSTLISTCGILKKARSFRCLALRSYHYPTPYCAVLPTG